MFWLTKEKIAEVGLRSVIMLIGVGIITIFSAEIHDLLLGLWDNEIYRVGGGLVIFSIASDFTVYFLTKGGFS